MTYFQTAQNNTLCFAHNWFKSTPPDQKEGKTIFIGTARAIIN